MVSPKRSALVVCLAATLVLSGCTGEEPEEPATSTSGASPGETAEATTDPETTTDPEATTEPEATADRTPTPPEVIATGLPVPWGLAFLPDGSALVSLRDEGAVLRITPGEEPVDLGTVPGVAPDGEGGLLGLAVSPDDPDVVFAYLTAAEDNRVVRLRLTEDGLEPEGPILTGIPRARVHNGGRIAVGPDGYLYVATGDATSTGDAQDPESLAGKILRVDLDGRPAPDNPDPDSPVWSSGHRNVQGLDWDDEGRMFASEFGQNTWDELNLIEPGANYGWPAAEGMSDIPDYTDPLHQWQPADASPSGLAVTEDAVYLAALRGASLWRVPLTEDGDVGQPERLLHREYGRLRTVAVDDEGYLWVITSNTYRGEPGPDDDRILRIDPEWLP